MNYPEPSPRVPLRDRVELLEQIRDWILEDQTRNLYDVKRKFKLNYTYNCINGTLRKQFGYNWRGNHKIKNPNPLSKNKELLTQVRDWIIGQPGRTIRGARVQFNIENPDNYISRLMIQEFGYNWKSAVSKR